MLVIECWEHLSQVIEFARAHRIWEGEQGLAATLAYLDRYGTEGGKDMLAWRVLLTQDHYSKREVERPVGPLVLNELEPQPTETVDLPLSFGVAWYARRRHSVEYEERPALVGGVNFSGPYQRKIQWGEDLSLTAPGCRPESRYPLGSWSVNT